MQRARHQQRKMQVRASTSVTPKNRTGAAASRDSRRAGGTRTALTFPSKAGPRSDLQPAVQGSSSGAGVTRTTNTLSAARSTTHLAADPIGTTASLLDASNRTRLHGKGKSSGLDREYLTGRIITCEERSARKLYIQRRDRAMTQPAYECDPGYRRPRLDWYIEMSVQSTFWRRYPP